MWWSYQTTSTRTELHIYICGAQQVDYWISSNCVNSSKSLSSFQFPWKIPEYTTNSLYNYPQPLPPPLFYDAQMEGTNKLQIVFFLSEMTITELKQKARLL